MGYIHAIQTPDLETHLIEPLLYATASGTSNELIATISNFTLITGAYVNIKVGTVNTNATLNVNNTGAKNIYYNGTQIITGMLTANNIYTFIYTGTYWEVIGDITSKNIMIGTTTEWEQRSSYVAPAGTIIIYTNHGTYTMNNSTITVPGIKISDGLAYVVDLPFVGDDVAATIRNELNNHINDDLRHITNEKRTFWDNKLNCDINNEVLIFNRS